MNELGRTALLASAVVAVAGGATLGSYWPSVQPFDITFLSVGQGDCTVIRSEGATFMVDVGPKTDDFDAGSKIIAPRLRQMGVSRVDILFLTHPDLDHIGGLAGLASRVRIERVAAPGYFRGHPELMKSLSEAGIKEEQVLWLDRPLAGESGSLRFQVQLPQFVKGEAENEGSLLIRFQLGASTAVLTGDASEETEAIEAAEGNWKADLLKAGHHGSATSTSNVWLKEVQPKLVIVSCGAKNPYGHPAPSTLERIKAEGADLLRTDRDGDLTFVPTPTGFQLEK